MHRTSHLNHREIKAKKSTRTHVDQIRRQKRQRSVSPSEPQEATNSQTFDFLFPDQLEIDQEPALGFYQAPIVTQTDLRTVSSRETSSNSFSVISTPTDTDEDFSTTSSDSDFPVSVRMTTPVKTSLDMPLRRSKEAPKTFKGKYSEVDSFLRHYDKLLRKCHVTDAKEQCELIIDYCSTKVAEYIKSEEHYVTPDWPKLRAEIRNYYDAEKVDQRYLPADLGVFTRRSARRLFHTLGQWKTYYRRYKAIAGNMGKNKMEDFRIAGFFWLGIHITLRRELDVIIRAQHPKRDTSKAPPMEHVKEAAEEYFKRDQFPANLLDARDYGYYGLHEADTENSEDSSSSSESSRSTSSEDSDTDEDRQWKKKFKGKLAQKKKDKKGKESRTTRRDRRKDELEVTRDIDCATKMDQGTSEVAEIIEKLNTMNIRDPHYGAVYYKALKMDPLVVQCIQREPLRIHDSPPVPHFNTQQRPPPPHMDITPRQSWKVEAGGPATYPNNIIPGERSFNPGCYGCAQTGHQINNCAAILSLLERGLIRRNPETQRFTMRDGAPIIRQRDETLAQAAERLGRPVSMFWAKAPILQDVGTAMEKQVMGYYWNSKGRQRRIESDEDLDSEEAEFLEDEIREEGQEFYEEDQEVSEEDNEESNEGYDSEEAEEKLDEDTEAEEWEDVNEGLNSEDFEGVEEDDTGYHTFQVWTPPPQKKTPSARVWEAERTVPHTRMARKAVFDGVLMPPLKIRPTGAVPRTGKNPAPKEAIDKVSVARVPELERPTKKVAPKEAISRPSMKDVPEQRPYDARRVRVQAPDEGEDIEMEDVSIKQRMRREINGPREIKEDSPSALQRKKTRTIVPPVGERLVNKQQPELPDGQWRRNTALERARVKGNTVLLTQELFQEETREGRREEEERIPVRTEEITETEDKNFRTFLIAPAAPQQWKRETALERARVKGNTVLLTQELFQEETREGRREEEERGCRQKKHGPRVRAVRSPE
ncbi:hypothetical protein DFH09DRAFT_1086128 [Mycena vulgaris]|nr:hypothetical protein DFH09DRAFT_1086128 [Mycena vulgaris]